MRFSIQSILVAATALAIANANPTPTLVVRQAEASLVTVVTVSGTPTTLTVEPSPTGLGECELHDDHWHCDGESADHAEEDHAGHDHSAESESELAADSHAGHNHGPSAEFGCSLPPLDSYNLGLHIGAIFILLAASSTGTFLPLITGARSRRPFFGEIFFICRHFGTGVILSTAFIHLLSHAMLYFANECIGELAFESTAPAIWVVFVVDFFLMRRVRDKARGAAVASGDKSSDTWSEDEERSLAESKVQTWDVLALEAGIIFHSVLIGVTLGAATGAGWVPLLITIAFHQFFEGLALGSRISLLTQHGALAKVGMALAYCVTTPVSIAIGVGVREQFNGNDRDTLITVGTLHAISAGILIYTALVELLAGDFIHGKGLGKASTARCIAAVVALTVGAAAMSVLGKWA